MASPNIGAGDNTPAPFKSQTQAPSSQFTVGNVPAPTLAYVPPDGFFRVNIQNSFNAAQVIVSIRTMRSVDGVVTLSQDVLAPTASGAINTFFLPGVEGFILSATARTENVGLRRGQCFVSIALCSGSQVDLHLQQILVQDYIGQGYAVAWPGGSIRLTTEGPGRMFGTNGAGVGPGAELHDLVPSAKRWRLLAASTTFVASAAAANRVPQVFILDTFADGVFRIPIVGLVTAGQSIVIQCMANAGQPAVNNGIHTLPLPDNLILPSQWVIATVTTGLQAADQYSSFVFLVEEWLES